MAGTSPAKTINARGAVDRCNRISFPGQPCALWERVRPCLQRADGFMVQNDPGTAFAVTYFTVRPDKTPVYEFASFRVQPNGRVELHSISLNAANYTVLQDAEFDCEIGSGMRFD